MNFIKIYLAGLVILAAAVAVNLLAGWLSLATWYEFFQLAARTGTAQAVSDISLINWIFLVFLYPFVLGAAACLVLGGCKALAGKAGR